MDPLKGWLLEQMKKEHGQAPGERFWRIKDWLTRVSMAEFESTRLPYIAGPGFHLTKAGVYEELVAPVKEEIKFWEKK